MSAKISSLLGQIDDGYLFDVDNGFRSSILPAILKFFESSLIFGLWLAAIAAFVFLIHFFFSLPMRRMERARLFLDLVVSALNRGQAVEEMILSLASSRDRTIGMRFHLLAAYVEGGSRFGDALEKVPRFLPPQISAILRAGEKLGDPKKVLPACRELLLDRPAAVRSAMHYLIFVVLLFSPVFIFVVTMTMVFVIPKFKEVAAGMGIHLPLMAQFVFTHTSWLIASELIITIMMLLATLLYIGGPGFVRWFQFRGLPVVDWIAWHVPWKQKRLQRTFSAMLAVLLDSGVAETEAVRLAGDCTANQICRQRSQHVIAAMEQGAKLDVAVHAFDDHGEFRWRLTNAIHARGGFLNALHGWHQALDAKAFQQEEAAAHTITSGLVILNGLLVALIATAMFGILMAVLNGMASE